MACAIILASAAVGLRPVLAMLREHYRKQPIDLRRPLQEFPVARLASFHESLLESGFVVLEASSDTLGTDEKLTLHLREKGRVGGSGQVLLYVTYYSEPEDKVPHTPEICYRQSDTIVRSIKVVTVDTPGLVPAHSQIEARALLIEQPHTHGVVMYCFCANGRFYYDRNQVRMAVTWPGDKYVYFSKIETVAGYEPGEDPTRALARCKRLLGEVLPILLSEHYPRTEDLKRR